MCEMILRYLPKEEAARQLEMLEKHPEQFSTYGSQCNFAEVEKQQVAEAYRQELREMLLDVTNQLPAQPFTLAASASSGRLFSTASANSAPQLAAQTEQTEEKQEQSTDNPSVVPI